MKACTKRPPVSSDSSKTRQLFTVNQLRKVPSVLMHASRNETSLAVKPPPSTIAWFASISACACAESSGTPRDSESRMMFALPDCAFTPMVGLAPTNAGSHHKIRARVLSLARTVHAGPRAKCSRTYDRRAVRRFKPEGRIGRVRQVGKPGQASTGTNSASPRSCMPPITVVKLTLPQRSPVPISVPCTCNAPARIAARVLAIPRPRSVWP